MKKRLAVILIMALSIYIFGCGKKQTAMQDSIEPISMDELSTMGTAPASPEAKVSEVTQTTAVIGVKLEPLPPAGPYKPTAKQIQAALKNAGFYSGEIDGKIGPQSKKAIEEFQKANNLQVDAKVGLKTWSVLSRYLNPEPAISTAVPLSKKK